MGMSEESQIRFVRRIWEAIRESGIEAGLELTPGVEWRPHAAGGQVLTSEEALSFMTEFQGERELLEVCRTPTTRGATSCWRPAASGCALRRISEFQIHWVYEFEDGKLRRAASYPTRAEALEAIGVDELDGARPRALAGPRRTLPYRPLGTGPTPVRRLRAALRGAGGEVWVKDDGTYGSVYGGNKVRKLEWILPDADGGRARSSPSVRSARTTASRRRCMRASTGCAARSRSSTSPSTITCGPARPVRALRRAALQDSRQAPHIAAAPWIMLRHFDVRRLRPPYFLTVGGSTPVGCVGFVEAAFELAEQVRAGELPEPSHVVVALGSGGTAAGLAAGLRLAGLHTRVVGIVVNDKTPVGADVVAKLANRTIGLLRRRGADVAGTRIEPTDLDAEPGFLGAGYGHRTAEAERTRADAAALEQLPLDPVYTAKAMTGLLALRAEGGLGAGPVLFWQSHDTRLAA